jgi:cell division protein FtsL
MARATTAAARSSARQAALPARPARRRPARPPRRRSGRGRAVARPAARRRVPARPRGAVMLDRLLRGRAWVLCVGLLLAGVVFFNVSLLELNEGIARTSERATALKQENARLRLRAARLGSTERIQEAAARRGLVLPAPGRVRYLRANPRVDGRRAARTFTLPEPQSPPPAVTQAAPKPAQTPTAGAPAQTTPQAQTAPTLPPAAQAQPTAGSG